MPYPEEDGGFTMGGYSDFPPHERPGYVPPAGQYPPPPQQKKSKEEHLAYGKDYAKPKDLSRESSYSNPGNLSRESSYQRAPHPGQYQYAQPPEKITYSAKPSQSSQANYTPNAYGQPPPQDVRYNSAAYGQPQAQQHSYSYSSAPAGQFHDQMPRTYSHNAYESDAHIMDITPGRERSDTRSSAKNSRVSVHTQQGTSLSAPRSPGLGPRMDRLSVSGSRPDLQGFGGGMPPPSPLLEAYHGTYQSISPMPLAIRPDDDLDDLDFEPLSPSLSREHRGGHKPNDRLAQDLAAKDRKEKKRVKLYDAEEDAKGIASALNHHKVNADAICDILPHLSHDQIMEVHKEYKKQVKVQGKGVNLSKHINMKLSGSMFGKAVYVTALGRWESEGYWANFWYQSHGSRRELLIESLMGRTNTEIRMIKDDFKDKRYSDSLTKCMEKELKMDKFRSAVLMVLEERRQEEQDSYPMEYVHRDVDMLYRSVRAEKGGESAMLEIIVRRSDAHLREVLRTYEKMYGENFARAALKKSNNLVVRIPSPILVLPSH